jgi:DNA-binding XRE family transcriptional regulator
VKCGASDIDELYDLMIKEARGFYRKEMGILFPEEIKSIRKKNGLTQEEFAKVLGFSNTGCFSSIEGGLTQTNYIDEMIRKCFNTSSALEILESNKTKISDDEYKIIKDKIIRSNY